MKNAIDSHYFRARTSVLMALCFSLLLSCAAQENTVDVESLNHETLKVFHKEHELTVAWWLPDDLWRAELTANSDVTERTVDKIIDTMHPFTVVVFVHGRFESYGNISYDTEQSIRDALVLVDDQGAEYESIDVSKTSLALGKMLDRMKPALAKMLGTVGEHLNFYVFPAIGKHGKRIADPKKEGAFSVQFKAEQFKWKLPLASLLPKKACPKCHENLSGGFKYCPYDGTALPE
jgi:hypothetical protein